MFIASQGPLSKTEDHFWEMNNKYGVKLIVMLCQLTEKYSVYL